MPQRLALLGVVGGPLIFLSSIAVLFGAYEQDGAHMIFSLPEAAFEASFAIYLMESGLRPRTQRGPLRRRDTRVKVGAATHWEVDSCTL